MTLHDRLYSDPIAVAMGFCAWLPLAIWILSLVRWMIGGEIDTLFGIVGIVTAVAVGYVSIVPPTPRFPYLTFPLAMGAVVLFPFVRYALERRELKAIDLEDVERCYDMIRRRPDNVAAKFRLARLLYEIGLPGHALRIAESCLANAPRSFFDEEHRMVQRWRYTPLNAVAFAPIPCSECGHANQAGNIHCAACGAPFLLHRVRGKIMPSKLGKRLLAGWIALVAIVVGIPVVGEIGGIVSVIGIIILMALAVGIVGVAFWDPGKEPSS